MKSILLIALDWAAFVLFFLAFFLGEGFKQMPEFYALVIIFFVPASLIAASIVTWKFERLGN